MTTDVFKLLSRYNSHVNGEMNKLLSTLSLAEWEKQFFGFYKSIKSLCTHIYLADFIWLKRFSSYKKFGYTNSPLFESDYSFKSVPFETVDEYKQKRNELDSLCASFVEELTDEDLTHFIIYKNLKGEGQNRNFGGLLMHMFNHQTHHRGMISVYLEGLSVENDFSSLFNIL